MSGVSQPLSGVRVLDLTRLLPGPLCSLMLAELGAEVVKVEAPMGGDYTRWFPPMRNEMSGAFASLNRNKRSLALNLKLPAGVDVLKRMLPQFDVLLEGFRPGVMERLGLGYEVLRELHPGLVYCSISGYGQTGPMAKKAGHDINYLARTGILSLLGDKGGEPALAGIQIADVAGGSWSAISHILAALFQRERTGVGAFCDVAMTQGVLPFLTMAMGEWGAGAPLPRRGEGALRGEVPCYGVYPCGDGRCLAVGSLEPKFWLQFVSLLGLPHLASDGLATGEEAARVRAEVESVLATKHRDEWVALFAEHDACVEPVWTVEEAQQQAHAQHRGYFVSYEHPTEGTCQTTGSPFCFGAPVPPATGPAPALGQDSVSVLEEAGFSEEERAALIEAGVILSP